MRIAFVFLLFSATAVAGKLPLSDGTEGKGVSKTEASVSSLEDLKMRKRFGIGISAGGPLAMLGLEADINVTPDFSISGGLGTGLDYSTFMLKGRYFLLGEWVSPYLGAGVARWWSDGGKTTDLSPSVLQNKFLSPEERAAGSFNAWIVYPCIGVQFMNRAGFDVFAELEYLFRLVSFSNGTYAGLGMHWYF